MISDTKIVYNTKTFFSHKFIKEEGPDILFVRPAVLVFNRRRLTYVSFSLADLVSSYASLVFHLHFRFPLRSPNYYYLHLRNCYFPPPRYPRYPKTSSFSSSFSL